MRLTYLLLPISFLLLAMTSGCHHRHYCCGGCASSCCAPCGSCCGYTPPMEGPMPPMAASPAPMVAPQRPTVGMRESETRDELMSGLATLGRRVENQDDSAKHR